jgi:hypothetical protein
VGKVEEKKRRNAREERNVEQRGQNRCEDKITVK